MASISTDDAINLTEKLQTLLQDSEKVSASLDDDTRRKLSEASRSLSIALEAPGDTVHRIVHSVSPLNIVFFTRGTMY